MLWGKHCRLPHKQVLQCPWGSAAASQELHQLAPNPKPRPSWPGQRPAHLGQISRGAAGCVQQQLCASPSTTLRLQLHSTAQHWTPDDPESIKRSSERE